MYHLFGGHHDEGTGMDGYAGTYETLADASAQVLKKSWDWADVALMVDGVLVTVATWETRSKQGRDTLHYIAQSGWLMADGSFTAVEAKERQIWRPTQVSFGTDTLAIGTVWPMSFVACDDDDQDVE